MDPVEETPLWETCNERTSEFTHFSLVVRLSSVKQLAFPFRTFFQCPAASAVLENPGLIHRESSEAARNSLKQDFW